MSVYVDEIRDYGDLVRGYARRYGTRWSHMIADSEDELHAFANKIGVLRRWAQFPGTPRSHYDIIPTKRALALRMGAIEITSRQLVNIRRRQTESSAVNEPPA
jgi:hypothetical protein